MASFQAALMAFLVLIITLFFGLSAIILAPFNPSGHLVHWFARSWSRTLLWIGRIHVDVRGLEHIPPGQPCILAANHASAADIPILFGRIPIQFRVIAKDSLFRIPVLGWCMRLAGYISIDRGSPTKAMRSLKKAAEKLKTGLPVLVFPEGTRSRTGALQPFNKGAFLLAIQAGVPVVPVGIVGSFDILVSGSKKIKSGVRVSVIMGPPIETSEYTPKERGQLTDEVQAAVERCLKSGDTTDSAVPSNLS